MRWLVLTALLAAPVAAQQPICNLRSSVADQLRSKYHERPIAYGMRGDRMFEFWLSEAGTWSFVITAPNGMSCITAAGDQGDTLPLRKGEAS